MSPLVCLPIGNWQPGHPMRPVISMIGTPEYELAKFLDSYIKPNIPKDFMLTSTSEFIDKLKLCSLRGNETMVSFDVSSRLPTYH